MTSRLKTISRLLTEKSARNSYVRTKLNQVIPSQIRALRLREDWTQTKLGEEADMKQARISAMEKPGQVNFNMETLVRLAAAFKVGLWVEFVPYSEMLRRDRSFSQDYFRPTRLPEDYVFLTPHPADKNGLIPDYDYSEGPLNPVISSKVAASPYQIEKGRQRIAS